MKYIMVWPSRKGHILGMVRAIAAAYGFEPKGREWTELPKELIGREPAENCKWWTVGLGKSFTREETADFCEALRLAMYDGTAKLAQALLDISANTYAEWIRTGYTAFEFADLQRIVDFADGGALTFESNPDGPPSAWRYRLVVTRSEEEDAAAPN